MAYHASRYMSSRYLNCRRGACVSEEVLQYECRESLTDERDGRRNEIARRVCVCGIRSQDGISWTTPKTLVSEAGAVALDRPVPRRASYLMPPSFHIG